jgi:hypothetical protein
MVALTLINAAVTTRGISAPCTAMRDAPWRL